MLAGAFARSCRQVRVPRLLVPREPRGFATNAFTVPSRDSTPEQTLFVVGLNEGKFFGQDSAEEALKLVERIAQHNSEYTLLLGVPERRLAEMEEFHKVGRCVCVCFLGGYPFWGGVQSETNRESHFLGVLRKDTHTHTAWISISFLVSLKNLNLFLATGLFLSKERKSELHGGLPLPFPQVKQQRLTPSRELEGSLHCEMIPIMQAGMVDKRPRKAVGRSVYTDQTHVAYMLWKQPREAVRVYWAFWRRKQYKDLEARKFWSKYFPVASRCYFEERAQIIAIRATEHVMALRKQNSGTLAQRPAGS